MAQSMEAATTAHLRQIEGGFHGGPWDQIEISEVLPGGRVEATISVDLIRRDEVPVDQQHVDELAASILEQTTAEDSGQLARVVLGHIPGEDTFRIIDGFHRDASLKQIGRTEYDVVILPDCTLEKIIDLRILTATTHNSISFSRIIEWVEEAWAMTEWSNKIAASQAFSAAAVKSVTGKTFDITPEEFVEMKEWVFTKCAQWKVSSPITIYQHLSVAKIADPALVKRARNRRGGHVLEEVTPAHVGVIAKALPNRFEEQNLATDIAIANNLTIPKTRTVVNILAAAETIEEATKIAEETDWSELFETFAETKTRELKAEENKRVEKEIAFRREFVLSELELAGLALQNLVLRGQYRSPSLTQHDELDTSFLIDYTDDPKIAAIAKPRNGEPEIDALLNRADVVAAGVMQSLTSSTSKHRLSKAQATMAFNNTVLRISQDIECGALGFVPLGSDRIIDTLIRTTLLDEVQLVKAGPPKNRTGKRTEGRVIEAPIATVVDVVADMPRDIRRAFILSTCYRAGSLAIGQILGRDAEFTRRVLERSNFHAFNNVVKALKA